MKYAHSRIWSPKPIAWAIMACLATSAYALPTGPQVVAGTAAVNQSGGVMTVQNSANAILNWQKFGIAAHETVRFLQPSASSAVLNRVVGSDPSAIYGQLLSNGRVWLINPAGVMIGPGGRIDTAGFVGSTLNIANQDFLAGRLNFRKGIAAAGDIVNQGSISTAGGGSVYLIGANVGNEGIVTTPQGEAILAAGETVNLIDTGTPGVNVEITGAAGNTTNLGQIAAQAGLIGMAGVLVKNAGALNASSVVSDGGRIFLKATKHIELTDTSRVAADGTRGGNIIAKTEDANGLSGTLRGRGEISAQGDGTPGSGGFVETSARRLDLNGVRVVTGNGTWLLDPDDFIIGTDITGAALGVALGNSSVTIQTSATTASCAGVSCTPTTVGGLGDIVVNEAVSWTSANTLRLEAYNGISINSGITATSSGVLSLVAGGSVTNNGTGLLNVSNLVVRSAGNVSITGANQVGTVAADVSGGFGFALNTSGGATTIGSVTDAVSTVQTTGITTAGGNIAVIGANAINVQAAIASNNGDISIQGSSITNTSAITNGGTTNTGTVSLIADTMSLSTGTLVAGAGHVVLKASDSARPITLGATTVNTLSLLGSDLQSISTSGILTIGAWGYTGPITVDGAITATHLGGVTGSGALSLIQSAAIDINAAITSPVSIGLQSSGEVTIDAPLTKSAAGGFIQIYSGTLTNSSTIDSSGGWIDLRGGAVDNSAGTISNGVGSTSYVKFVADTLTLAGGTVDAHAGNVRILTNSPTQHMNIGSAAGAFSLLPADLQTITTSGGLDIGLSGYNTSGITVTDNVSATDLAGVTDGSLSLLSAGPISIDAALSSPVGVQLTTGIGSGVTQTAGVAITAPSLAVTAGGNVSLLGSNAVSSFRADVSSSTVKSDVFFKNTQSLNIAAGGIQSYMLLGDVGLWLTSGDLTQSGIISGAALVIRAEQGNVTLTNPNAVVNLAASVGTMGTAEDKNFRFNDANTLNVSGGLTSDGNFSSISGINTAFSTPAGTSAVTTGLIDLTTVTGNITQSAGNLLAGRAVRAVAASGAAGPGSVLLTQNNPTGIIAGAAGSAGHAGDFEYTSQNAIYVSTVGVGGSQSVGVSTANTGSHVTLTSITQSVSQNTDIMAHVSTKLLNVTAATGIALTESTNSIASVGAIAASGGIAVFQNGESTLTVTGASGVAGAALAADIAFSNTHPTGTITVSGPINVAADHDAYLAAPGALNINAAVTGGVIELRSDDIVTFSGGGSLATSSGTYPGLVHFGTYTSGNDINVASNLTGVSTNLEIATGSLANINSSWVVFGSKDATHGSGALTVNGVTGASFAAVPDVLGFLTMDGAGNDISLTNVSLGAGTFGMSSGGNISGTGLQAAGVVAEARNTGTIDLTFTGGVTVSSLTTSTWDGTPESHSGMQADGNIDLTTGGPLVFNQPLTTTGIVSIDASGTISGTGTVTGSGLSLLALGDIGSSGAPLATAAGTLSATSSNGSIYITNNTSGSRASATLSGASAANDISITNWGGFTISGGVSSTGTGDIALTAGVAQSSDPNDVLTVNTAPTTSGAITLAGYSVGGSDVPAGAVLQIYTPPAPPPPSVEECTANPSLSGCSSVLPSLDSCITNPTLAGCTAILPSIDTCVTNPTAAGCTAVLPPLDTCTTNPTLPGCTAVLPSVDTCVTTPTAPGCSVVLPTLDSCTTNPTLPGCTAVLPSVDACTTNPTAAGCTAVLPSIATCTTTPSAPGCGAVLPSLDNCTTNPTLAGCSAVLPSVDTCTTNPAAAGCGVVLPTLSSCTTNPSQAGCSAVLPTVATCTTNPTTPGCTAVLPTETTTDTTSQVIVVIQELTQTTTPEETTGPAPLPPPLPPTGPATLGLTSTTHTIGGTEGTFGGASNGGSGGGSAPGSGATDGNGGAADSGNGASGEKEKSAAADDKNEDKTEETAKKDEDKPAKKTIGQCS